MADKSVESDCLRQAPGGIAAEKRGQVAALLGKSQKV
jgi:hypothetical protein